MTEEYDSNLEPNFPANTDESDVAAADFIAETDLLQAVEVQTQAIAERQRLIRAQIQISHPVEQVWQILTDYEALASFIPNLAKSRLLDHPAGGIRLEQVGTQKLLRFNFSARVVLDIEENFPHEINFTLVEGDLKDYSGSWRLEQMKSARGSTNLCYTARVWPKRTTPVAIIERRLCSDLRLNLLAIRQRAEELFG